MGCHSAEEEHRCIIYREMKLHVVVTVFNVVHKERRHSGTSTSK